jgi:hypothetical protein
LSKKSEAVAKLLEKVVPRSSLPEPVEGLTLLEQGLLVVLRRHLSQAQAASTLRKMRGLYPDWNELRVSQAQEIASLMTSGKLHAPLADIQKLLPIVCDTREYLQEVFQKTHGFDLDFLKDDAGALKLVTNMPFLGTAGASWLLWLANGRQVPVHAAMVRALDRIGIVTRGAGSKKQKELVEPHIPKGEELRFVAAVGELVDRWCTSAKPLCHECPLVDDCIFGKKNFQEWKVAQARAEAQRIKDDARRAILEKKEAAKRAREDARLAKLAEAEAKKKARDRERVEREVAKRKEAERKVQAMAELAKKKKLADEKARVAAEKQKARDAEKKAAADKKAAERKAAEKKALEQKQKALELKKAADKKAAELKKAAEQKKAAEKKQAAEKKAAAEKLAEKKRKEAEQRKKDAEKKADKSKKDAERKKVEAKKKAEAAKKSARKKR